MENETLSCIVEKRSIVIYSVNCKLQIDVIRTVAELPPAQNDLPEPNHGSKKSDWLEQTNKQTLTIFHKPITISFRKGNNQLIVH